MDQPVTSTRSLWRDASLPAVAAGFVAVLVGFTSSVAIVFQAATALGATPTQLASWMWALGLGMGLCCLLPSWWLRMPVVAAWSTPGAAVLAAGAAAGGYSLAQATGAFIAVSVLIAIAGFSGLFERMMNRLPLPLAAALLAGVLARFGLQAFTAAGEAPWLVITLLMTYLLGKRYLPRYAVLGVLAAGVLWVVVSGDLHTERVQWAWAVPQWVTPEWHLGALIGLGVPLFIVTMASQNLPGVAAIRAAGYAAPVSPLVGLTGVVTALLAPFGAFALNLAAITAAICMGREAHEDPQRRYVAAMAAGAFYILIGLFGGAVTGLLVAFPSPFIAALAGLALLGTIASALVTAVGDERLREPALITFLVTLSGVTLLGVGSAFWGVVAGGIAVLVQRRHA